MLFKLGTLVKIKVPKEQGKSNQLLHNGIARVASRKLWTKPWPKGNYVLVEFISLPNNKNKKSLKAFPIYPIKRDWLEKIESQVCQCDFKEGRWSCECGLGRLEILRKND